MLVFFVDELCEKLEPNEIRFINIVIGRIDNEFEGYCNENKVNMNNFDLMVRAAKKYCNITKQDLKDPFFKKMFGVRA